MKKNQVVENSARQAVFDSVSGGANSEDFEDTLMEEPSKAHLLSPLNFNLQATQSKPQKVPAS
jgi:hypothetical protein